MLLHFCIFFTTFLNKIYSFHANFLLHNKHKWIPLLNKRHVHRKLFVIVYIIIYFHKPALSSQRCVLPNKELGVGEGCL